MISEHADTLSLSGWGVSLIIHAAAVWCALYFASQKKPLLQEEVFKWDVALVEHGRDITPPETPVAPPVVQPPKPVQAQPTHSVEPSRDMPQTPVPLQQSIRTVHPVIETPKPVEQTQPIQEVVQPQPKPIEREETKKEEIKEPEPIAKEAEQGVTPIIESVAAVPSYTAPTSVPSQPVAEHHSEPVPSRVPSVAEAEPASGGSSHSPMVDALPSARIDASTSPSDPGAREQPPVVASTVAPRSATKVDYTWLVESLSRRIAVLTHYPSTARLNEWEGRVVLKAVIRSDGHLLEVTVHRSSGHGALDRAAIETIKLACPLHLKQALDTRQVVVYVPIVYSLSGSGNW